MLILKSLKFGTYFICRRYSNKNVSIQVISRNYKKSNAINKILYCELSSSSLRIYYFFHDCAYNTVPVYSMLTRTSKPIKVFYLGYIRISSNSYTKFPRFIYGTVNSITPDRNT